MSSTNPPHKPGITPPRVVNVHPPRHSILNMNLVLAALPPPQNQPQGLAGPMVTLHPPANTAHCVALHQPNPPPVVAAPQGEPTGIVTDAEATPLRE